MLSCSFENREKDIKLSKHKFCFNYITAIMNVTIFHNNLSRIQSIIKVISCMQNCERNFMNNPDIVTWYSDIKTINHKAVICCMLLLPFASIHFIDICEIAGKLLKTEKIFRSKSLRIFGICKLNLFFFFCDAKISLLVADADTDENQFSSRNKI